ncbi:hypothetical protein [Polaribacter sp.]|uniref:hypothetical protein n=1 Tax=Polaribacter sp. TaxID=1920175 RepID=UPI003EF7CA14
MRYLLFVFLTFFLIPIASFSQEVKPKDFVGVYKCKDGGIYTFKQVGPNKFEGFTTKVRPSKRSYHFKDNELVYTFNKTANNSYKGLTKYRWQDDRTPDWRNSTFNFVIKGNSIAFYDCLKPYTPDKIIETNKECDDYRKLIYTLQGNISKAAVKYTELVKEMEAFDKNTRVNFCTKTVDHYSQVGTLEFDESWNNYLSGVSDKFSYLGKIPVLSEVVDKTTKLVSYLLVGLDEWESLQLPIDDAWATFQDIRKVRSEVIDNYVHALRIYYCREIFEYDKQLYDLYHHQIPNSKSCNDFEKNALINDITRNRPAGLAPIWVKRNYLEAQRYCN